jgi:hypothetical protein
MDPSKYMKIELVHSLGGVVEHLNIYWIIRNDEPYHILTEILNNKCDTFLRPCYEYHILCHRRLYTKTAAFVTPRNYIESKRYLDAYCALHPDYIMTNEEYERRIKAQEILPPERESQTLNHFLNSLPKPNYSQTIPRLEENKYAHAMQLQCFHYNNHLVSKDLSNLESHGIDQNG